MNGQNLSREICAALRDLLRARTEWDEAPAVYNMYWDGGAVRLRPVLPEGVWPPGSPGQVLRAYAEKFMGLDSATVAHILPAGFIGMAFRSEMWEVRGAVGQQPHALLAGPRPSQHPDRVEQRVIWAFTCSNIHYQAFQNRGEKEVHAHKMERAEGNIPEALQTAVHALTAGVT